MQLQQAHCASSYCGVRSRPAVATGAFRPTAAAVLRSSSSRCASPLAPAGPSSSPHRHFSQQTPARRSRDVTVRAIEPSQALGLALFFTPGLLGLVYAYFKGKGNVKDGLSRMLTEFSKGYFQPDVGGKNIPVATGELSDLAGDEPLFKALYQW